MAELSEAADAVAERSSSREPAEGMKYGETTTSEELRLEHTADEPLNNEKLKPMTETILKAALSGS